MSTKQPHTEILAAYRAAKRTNPFLAARIRAANAGAIRDAEAAEHPEQHAAEIRERAKQAAVLEFERVRSLANVDSDNKEGNQK